MRAEQLAYVVLTRRQDLVVRPHSGSDRGIDLVATLRQDGQETGRQFAVEVKATSQPLAGKPQSGIGVAPHVPTSQDMHRRFRDMTIPVAIFYFAMRDGDRGFFRWLLEPDPILPAAPRWNDDDQTIELTRERLDEIVDQVNRWYDARQLQAAA
jgi:hypothetical protein